MSLVGPILATAAFGITAYVGVSIFFLKNPQYLHKRKKIPFNARHISHRGGAGECLENTMHAFKHAVDSGTEMLELDVHLTKDNQIVVSHDQNLFRTTGIQSNIGDLLYDELPLLKESLDLHGASVLVKTGDCKIPLLKTIFDTFPNIPINIDIKMDDDFLIAGVSSLIKAYKREHITVWGSFRDTVCIKCYKHNPDIHLLFSLKRVGYLILSFYLGFLPFISIKENFYETAMLSTYLKDPTLMNPRFLSRRQKLIVRFANFLIMRKWMFEHLQRRGLRVYLFVLNTELDFDRGFSYGVDGVMTDFPMTLTDYLIKHPIPNNPIRKESENLIPN